MNVIRALVALAILALIVALRRQREATVQLGPRNDTTWSSGVTWAGGSW